MWIPPYNMMNESEIRSMVDDVGSAGLITVSDDGWPIATRLPVIWEGDRLVFHMAIANPHWRVIVDGTPTVVVVTGPEAYISPSWYAAKLEHGRVVPTWNYSAIHFTGRATVHRDPEWLLNAVTALSNQHEQSREKRWAVTDAPDGFIAQQLRAIVGIELVIERIEAKSKRSQNRPLLDREEVINGLRTTGGHRERAMAEQMERVPHTRGVSLAQCHRGRDQGADDASPRSDGQGRAITQVCLERRVVDGLLNARLSAGETL